MRFVVFASLVLGQGQPTVYEYEAPPGYLRFTTDRASIPRGARWRVFKQGEVDAGVDAGSPARTPKAR